jgi:hypothetical protein
MSAEPTYTSVLQRFTINCQTSLSRQSYMHGQVSKMSLQTEYWSHRCWLTLSNAHVLAIIHQIDDGRKAHHDQTNFVRHRCSERGNNGRHRPWHGVYFLCVDFLFTSLWSVLMKKELIDELWNQATRETLQNGTLNERYHFATLIAAHEREQCAMVCEDHFSSDGDWCAKQVRARSNNG